MDPQDARIHKYNRLMVGLFLAAVAVALVIMARGIGTEGKDYGPGAYYYTDIPGWQEIFYPEVYQ